MKLLRSDLDDAALLKLTDAVQQSARYNLPYSDRDVEQQVDVWLEGLLGNDQVCCAAHQQPLAQKMATGQHGDARQQVPRA